MADADVGQPCKRQHVACSPLLACRDFGPREDRQKTRLMWLVEDMGVDAFRDKIAEYMGDTLRPAVHATVRPRPA